METIILIVFVLGYLAIAFEHPLKINKAASALFTGVVCWAIFILAADSMVPGTQGYEQYQKLHGYEEALENAYNSGANPDDGLAILEQAEEASSAHGGDSIYEYVLHELGFHVDEIAQILFFLIGAMTIVELVDIHGGFEVITRRIKTRNKLKLLWIIAILTFFMSAALDNLTTSIVMVSLLSKIIEDRKDRLFFAGMIVIAANSGGAWSPIGDVTTTMLWIDDKITAPVIIVNTIIPSLVSLLVPLGIVSMFMKGDVTSPVTESSKLEVTSEREKKLVLGIGLAGLIFVPVFKIWTHLPPFMGMMLSLGVLWGVTELLNKSKRDKFKEKLSPAHALERIDTPSMLFFLGILLAVGVLQVSGMLAELAGWLDSVVPNRSVTVTAIGLLSALVDNVPLVAGALEMYPSIETDAHFWQYLAYCAGTGGSVLIIGSAAGVAVMGIEKVEFFWYLKKISWLALIGYFAGAGAFLLMDMMGLMMGSSAGAVAH